MVDDIASQPWKLSAPESLVLLWGPETSERDALTYAILDLIAREALAPSAVVEHRFLLFKRRVDILTPGRYAHAITEPTLLAVSIGDARPKPYSNGLTGAPVKRVAGATLSRYQRKTKLKIGPLQIREPSGGYVRDVVLPSLESRGLFAWSRASSLLGGQPVTWELTPAGDEALGDLRRLMMLGRADFPDWVRVDPERAARFVERAGPAVLLLPEVASLLPGLVQRAPAASPGHAVERADAPGWGSGPTIFNAGAGFFTVAALASTFGPTGFVDAFEMIASEVDAAWNDLAGGNGGGGE